MGLHLQHVVHMSFTKRIINLFPKKESPGIPTTIKTKGVNITTIVYLRVLIIQTGSIIIFMGGGSPGNLQGFMGYHQVLRRFFHA